MDTENISKFTKEFHVFLQNIQEYEPIAIISHDNTDLDGAASALGLYYLIKQYSQNSGKIDLILSHTNQFVTHMLQNQQIVENLITNYANIREAYNTIIIVDTSYIPPYFDKVFQHLVLIDHHLEPVLSEEYPSNGSGAIQKSKVLAMISDSSASSCSEIIGKIWKTLENSNQPIQRNSVDNEEMISQLLLMGLLMDSGGLRFSENSVIPIIDFFIQKGADLPTARRMSIREVPFDVKVARIKGAIRTEEPILIGDWILLITKVNSHESAVCTALLGLGADLAFCISKRKKKAFRIIARTSERFQHAENLHLGKFMENLAQEYNGNSGGHKGAAGMNGKDIPHNLKEIIVGKLKKELNN